jgi:hypothetical protein
VPDWIQTVQTGFGDVTDPDPVTGAGSELDWLNVTNTTQGKLVVALGGNLEPNGNAIQIYFDTDPLATSPNGITTLPGTITQSASELRSFAGMDGDTLPFSADYVLVFENGGFGPGGNFITLTAPSSVSGEDLGNGGSGASTSGLVDYSVTSARDIQVGLNNSNIDGVSGGFGLDADDAGSVTTGYEVAVPLADLGLSVGDLVQVWALVTGNTGFLSEQFMPPLATPLPPQSDPGSLFANLGGVDTPADLAAAGAFAVATYLVGEPTTGVRDYTLYR